MKKHMFKETAFNQYFKFYLILAAGVIAFFLTLSHFNPNINDLIPYILFFIGFSMSCFFTRDCIAMLTTTETSDDDNESLQIRLPKAYTMVILL